MQDVAIDDGPVRIVGALDLVRSASGLTPRRLPAWTRPQVPGFTGLVAAQGSGVRVEFSTDSTAVELEAMVTGLAVAGRPVPDAVFDLVVDDRRAVSIATRPGSHHVVGLERIDEATLVAGEVSTVRFDGLDPDLERCALWLPPSAAVELRALRIDDGATVVASEVAPQRRWLHYGSSISQCSGAISPTRTWPAIAARAAGVDLVNLALAGSCHLDPFVATTLRHEPADVVSLELGINVAVSDSLKERTFIPAVHGLVDAIRETKPEVPILVVSPIICPELEERPGPRGRTAEASAGSLSLRRIREILSGIVEQRRRSDVNLHHLDGLELFGPADVDELPDGLHPSGAGYATIGQRFTDLAFAPGRPLAA